MGLVTLGTIPARSIPLCGIDLYCSVQPFVQLWRLTKYWRVGLLTRRIPRTKQRKRELWLSTKERSSGLTTPRATDSSDVKTGRTYLSTTHRSNWTGTKH